MFSTSIGIRKSLKYITLDNLSLPKIVKTTIFTVSIDISDKFLHIIATIFQNIVHANKLRVHKQTIIFQILFMQVIIRGGNPVVFKDMYACVYVFCGRPRLGRRRGERQFLLPVNRGKG